jgi:alkylated DNA repair dioxygenase AlkB
VPPDQDRSGPSLGLQSAACPTWALVQPLSVARDIAQTSGVSSEQAPRVAWQASLFDTATDDGAVAAQRLSFTGLRRDWLDERSWIDVVPGWVTDHGALFDRLREIAPWQQRTRTMWDKDVLEPRLVAGWQTGERLPPEVVELVEPLSARYAVPIDSCLINLYRDGSDAVAWHADTVRKVLRDPLVFTVSLGARRSFLLRPATGGPVARRYAPGEGDLIVMGGACQHEWHHTVPRERSASGARMSITLRHSRPAAGAPPATAPSAPAGARGTRARASRPGP